MISSSIGLTEFKKKITLNVSAYENYFIAKFIKHIFNMLECVSVESVSGLSCEDNKYTHITITLKQHSVQDIDYSK